VGTKVGNPIKLTGDGLNVMISKILEGVGFRVHEEDGVGLKVSLSKLGNELET